MKVPFASKKIMKWNILIFLPFLGIASLVYVFWYFTGEFTRMAFGVPLLLLTDLKLLEELEDDI